MDRETGTKFTINNFASKIKMIGDVLKFIVYTLIFWTLFPVLYVLLSPFYIFRLILSAVQKWRHPEWIGLMNLRDAFLYENMQVGIPITHAISTCAVVKHVPMSGSLRGRRTNPDLDSELEEHARNLFRKVLDPLKNSNGNSKEEEKGGKFQRKEQQRGQSSYEKLSWYAETWCGFPFYKREKQFRLENHVKLCEKFRGREISEEELELFISERTSEPFSRGISPWECLVMRVKKNGHGDEPRGVLFFRFHHMLGDGLSMLKIFRVMDKDQLNTKVKRLSAAKFTWMTKLLFAAKFLLFVGCDVVSLLIFNKDKNLWTIPRGQLKGQLHTLSSSSLDYELIKKASKSRGASATAAIFSCFAGGIHNYLRQNGTGSEADRKNLPATMQMGVASPVPNHPLEGMVNHWTFATVTLPIGDPDQESRVAKIEENLLHLIRRGTTLITWLMAPLHAAVPYRLLDLLAYNDMTTLLASNFPGPRGKLELFEDWELEQFRGYLPRLRSNCAVGMSSLTYNDTVTFYLCVDKGLMPQRASAQRLMNLIENELVILAGGKRRA